MNQRQPKRRVRKLVPWGDHVLRGKRARTVATPMNLKKRK